ncbi:PC-esterase domain-containing protein 1A-like [Macrosteles quadrilineatus]|uniref:PC-esterase domain-containing protein 1A-like n=1 Tax=Macrosteles quadrilineatus TaxID=74068 RepID=UPI0023E137A4|nr:PC-esterase domain-containing protein 1A-like [Macrosteles quadrilineatus]
MADVFMHSDAKSLLRNRHILFLGDSNMRAQYKDLTWLLNFNKLITQKSLRSKLEHSFLGDNLIGRSKVNHGRDFKEKRIYNDQGNGTVLEFSFLTRCYNRQLEELFNNYKKYPKLAPDVIVMNSCLWDLTRWGPNGAPEYKDNMVKLMRLMCHCLPKQCLVIWSTALPTAPHIKGALIIKQIKCIESMIRFEVMEANTFAREVVVSHGFDVLDNHYYTRMQMHRRAKDGVHYLPVPVRLLTNLLLTHIALSWGKKLPNNIQTILLDKAKQMDSKKPEKKPEVKIPTTGIFSKINLATPVKSRAKGISVTFTPGRGGRRCNLEDDECQVASTSGTNTVVRSVVQIPTNNRHAAAGPYRYKKKNKKNKKRPYDRNTNYDTNRNRNCSYYNPRYTTPSFYNPYPYTTSNHYDDSYSDYNDEEYNYEN